jgi:hypothetical protein
MSEPSIEYLVDLNNKLSAEVARLEAEIASRDKHIKFLEESVKKLAPWLGESHSYMQVLLSWMERAEGNIPPELREFIKEARMKLTLRQNAFLKEFGDMNEPGEN